MTQAVPYTVCKSVNPVLGVRRRATPLCDGFVGLIDRRQQQRGVPDIAIICTAVRAALVFGLGMNVSRLRPVAPLRVVGALGPYLAGLALAVAARVVA